MISEWVPFLLAKKAASSTPANKCTRRPHGHGLRQSTGSLRCSATRSTVSNAPTTAFILLLLAATSATPLRAGGYPRQPPCSPATCSMPPWPASFCFLGPAATSMELMDIDFSPVLGFLGAPSGPASAAISSEHLGVVYLLWFSSLVASTEALHLP